MCTFVFTENEIIKVRERILHIGLTKAILLKLFVDIVPSSFADITRALCGCFRGGSVYAVSFHKAKKTLQCCEEFFDILITSEQGNFGSQAPGMLNGIFSLFVIRGI